MLVSAAKLGGLCVCIGVLTLLTNTGVVDQIMDGEDPACNEPIEPCEDNPNQALCLYRDRVDVYEMEAELSIGPVFARHIGHRLYRGEYYYTQSDAHVSWTQDWDVDIVKQMEATKNEMAVLTTYLTDVQGSIDENGHSLRNTRPIMCNTDYEGGGNQATHLRHGSQPERVPSIKGVSQMQVSQNYVPSGVYLVSLSIVFVVVAALLGGRIFLFSWSLCCECSL